MRKWNQTIRTIRAAVVAAAGIALAAPALGQGGWPQAGTEGPVISVTFPGGTVEQFVAALRAASPEPVNIVAEAEAGRAEVPAMTLKNVEVYAALESVSALYADAGQNSTIRVSALRPNQEGASPLYVLSRVEPFLPGPQGLGPVLESPRSQRALRVASVKEIVCPPADSRADAPSVPVEQILSAIDTVLGLPGESREVAPASIKYHADTGLLVYEGSHEQIEAIEDVLKQVRDDVMKQRAQWLNATERTAENAYEREKAEVNLGLAHSRYTFARDILEDAKARQQAGVASAAEVAEAAQRYAEAQAEMQLAEARERKYESRPAEGAAVVVYDIRDFGAFIAEVTRLVCIVGRASPSPAGDPGLLTLRAGEEEHRMVQEVLTTLRRVRANDPRLEPKPSWKTPEGPK